MTAQATPASPPALPSRSAPRSPLGRGLRYLGLLLLLGVALLSLPRPISSVASPHATATEETLSDYVARRIAKSRDEGVRPGNEERLAFPETTPAPTRAKVAILYIHGFGASRAEGEASVEPLAKALGAVTYYTRLPGHGADLEQHAAGQPAQYFERVEEDFHHLRKVADKLLIVGSSTGGLLAAWLAARHPREVDGVVLASPLIEMAPPGSFLLSRWLGMRLIRAVMGEFRDAGWRRDPEGRKGTGYEDYWLTKQRMSALAIVEDVRRQGLREAPPQNISAPILLLYHYADPAHQDTVCSVAAMRSYVDRTRGGTPHPLTRSVAIADGNHILLSQYVRTDKATIGRELLSFAQAVLSAQ